MGNNDSITVFNDRELATVLHGLRIVQELRENAFLGGCWDAEVSANKGKDTKSCDHFEEVKPLTDEQIDSLCERLNCSTLAQEPVGIIERMEAIWPWLMSEEENQISGADTIQELQDFYDNLKVSEPPSGRVVVRVEGGVAQFLEVPVGVDAVLIDYDTIGSYRDGALESAISSLPEDLQSEVREYFIGDDPMDVASLFPETVRGSEAWEASMSQGAAGAGLIPHDTQDDEPEGQDNPAHDSEPMEPENDVNSLPPDPENMNDERAQAAKRTVKVFASDFGEEWKDTDEEGYDEAEANAMIAQNVSDLIADCAHLCDREGIDMEDMVSRAKNHYREETLDDNGVSQGNWN